MKKKKAFKIPEAGTIFTGQVNDSVENPGPVNDAVKRQEWELAQARDTAASRNATRVEEYTNDFTQRWLVNYEAGRIPYNAQPLQPPAARVVLVREAEAGGIYFDVLPSGGVGPDTGPFIPVCAVPKYKRATPPQH